MGWSQRELAARWGRSESLVSKIEQGVKRLDSVDDARRLADLARALRPAGQPPAVGHALISIAGEMAALAAGTLALDMGHYRQAGPYLDLAAHAAHATCSAELEAVVLAGRSLVLANGFGQHKVALEVAELACEVSAGGGHTTTRARGGAACSGRVGGPRGEGRRAEGA